MKKFSIVGLALAAVFAFCAVTASAAFAESEFLLGGTPLAAGKTVTAEGGLELTDLKVPLLGAVTVLCTGILDSVSVTSKTGEVTEVLNTAKEKVTALGASPELALECTAVTSACGTPLVWPDNLSSTEHWLTEIVLDGGTEFLLRLFGNGTGKEAGWDIECMSGLGSGSTDLCEGATTFLMSNAATDVLVEKTKAEAEAEENGTCTQSKEKSGEVITQGENLILSEEGTLQVS